MNIVNIEFIRDCLLRAFHIPSSSPGCSVDNAVETRKSASQYMRRPSRIETLEDYSQSGTLEHYSIHVPTEPVRASETMRYKGGKFPLLPTAFEDTAWIRAVRESTPVHSAWLKYCYSDDLSWPGQISLCQFIWGTFWPESLKLGVIPKPETEARLRTLVWLSVQAAKQQVNRGTPMFTDSELAEILHIHKSVFSRSIKWHWLRLLEHCLQLDYEALANADRHHRSRKQH